MKKIIGLLLFFCVIVLLCLFRPEDSGASCGAYVAPGVWKEFDCYNLAAIGKTTNDDPFTPSWRLIGGYWQWGRKGPDASQWYDTNTANFAHGPTGPDAGVANSGEISGWSSTEAPDGSWSDSSKTANDPCPAGFRVPTQTQWDGVINNNTSNIVGTWSESATNYSSARFFGNGLMLPAAGYRSGSGFLYGLGDYGGYWSSMLIPSAFPWCLGFDSYNAYTYEKGSSTYGLPVRCMAEGSSSGPGDAPRKPVLLSPSNGVIDVSLTPTLTTQVFSDPDPDDTHTRTDWQISAGPDFSFIILAQESTIHMTSLPIPDMILEQGKTYYWQVRFYDSQSNVSEWSDAFSFTTLQTFTDTNRNGIPDDLENLTVDLDNDGTPDIQQTDTIKTLNSVVGSGQMGVSIKDSETVTELISVNSIDPENISLYARPHSMPLGMVSYRVKVANPGDTARVKVYFSDQAPANASWFFHDTITGWTDHSQHVTFSDDRMSAVVELKDGDYGDADGIVNGIIVDPSGFGIGSWLSGTITDAANSQGISNAVISFPDINLSLNTLTNGQYLTLLLPGIYDMTVSASGYQSVVITDIGISEADIVTQNTELSGWTRILGFTATGTPSTLTSVNYTINAQSGSSNIQYRYSIHYGYGTPEYTGLNWQSMTGQSMTGSWFQPDRSCSYTFNYAGKSIIVIWATSADTENLNPSGIPIIGWSVDTSGAACSTNFTGVSITGDQKANENITFTVNAQNSCNQALYYRFSMHPDYGTAGYDGTQWQSMTGSEWITDNFTDYTFTRTGKYIIVVWVTDDPYAYDHTGIPIIGWSVDIE